MKKIHKGDEVIVIKGRDKSKRGVVLRRVDDEYLVVEGVRVVKKHVRPNPMRGIQGGVMEQTQPIHQSNVAIFNKATGKADRVGIKVQDDGTRVRVFKSSGEQIKEAAR